MGVRTEANFFKSWPETRLFAVCLPKRRVLALASRLFLPRLTQDGHAQTLFPSSPPPAAQNASKMGKRESRPPAP